jgi:hypothetical protein
MGDITGIVIVLGISYTIYKLVELFVCRKERLALIEKATANNSQPLIIEQPSSSSGFSALKIGSLMAGLGLGLVIAAFTATYWYSHPGIIEINCLACMMLGGGLGLIIAWGIEKKSSKK